MAEENRPEGGGGEDTVVPRETPSPDSSRAALVQFWQGTVEHAKNVYESRFNEMREMQRFVRGQQWPMEDPDKYVVNVTQRHISQRTAQLYAKNPKAVAHVRKRLENTVWDGSQAQIDNARQTLATVQQAAPALVNGADPVTVQKVQAQAQDAQAIIADYQQAMTSRRMRERMGETLELLYDYQVDEQQHPFKVMMKLAVRRALTTGVGWVKLGFQRATRLSPNFDSRIRDLTEQLRMIEQRSADLADGELSPDSAKAEDLRLQIEDIRRQETILLREGLVFDFPQSTCIIPDTNTKNIKTFLGTGWAAEEFLLTPDQVQQIYGISLGGSGYERHKGRANPSTGGTPSFAGAPAGAGHGDSEEPEQEDLACVYEIYCKTSGLVYVICKGYPEFLQEPAEPDVWTERFFPWFAIVPNEVDDDDKSDCVFPPSDVELIKHQQMEINRAREALREHRIANRPLYAVAAGMLDESDRVKLENRPAHGVIEVKGLQPGQDVNSLLQRVQPAPVDPALYDVNPQFEDILRAGGLQEANLGGTAGGTATESAIAQASLSVTSNSTVDDLDDVLTALARAGGQILLANVSRSTVVQIVGPGAMWPTLTREQIARELWLEVEAGSTGRPNQGQEIANAERIVPLLLQIPGINPEWLAKELIRRLDDRMDLNSAMARNIPSVIAMNAQAVPRAGTAPAPGQPSSGQAPRPPAPPTGGPPLGGVDTTTPGPDSLTGL